MHRPDLMSDHSKLERQRVWVTQVKFGYITMCLRLIFPSVMWQRYNHLALSSFTCSGWKLKDWGENWAWAPQISRGAAVITIAGRVGKEGIAACYLDTCFGFWWITPGLFFYSLGECSNCRIPAYTHSLQWRLCHQRLKKEVIKICLFENFLLASFCGFSLSMLNICGPFIKMPHTPEAPHPM